MMKWMIFFLMLPHLQPACFEYLWPVMDVVFNAGRVFSGLMILYLYILRGKIPSKPIWLLLASQVWVCICTYLSDGEMKSILIQSVSILAVTLLVHLFVDRPGKFIQALMMNLEWLIYVNLVSVLLYFPDGMYKSSQYYFLGHENGLFQYVLLTCCVAVLYGRMFHRWGRSAALITAGYVSIFYLWSATSVVALLLVGMLTFLPIRRLKRWITFHQVFFVSLGINVAVVGFRIMEKVRVIIWFIEVYLKKDVTLTYRTFIWDRCIALIAEHPVMGVGANTGQYVGAVNAHNQYLELLLSGGVPLLAMFLALNLMVGDRLKNMQKNPCAYGIFCSISGLYVIFIAEAYLTPLVYMLLVLAYYADRFDMFANDTSRQGGYRIVETYKVSGRNYGA